MYRAVLPFESPRKFMILSYSVSHGQLLLRSQPEKKDDIRIDVLFKAVMAMELRARSEGLHISKIPFEELEGLPSRPLDLIGDGQESAYLVSGKGWSGYVLGLSVFTVEDYGPPLGRSILLGPEIP